MKKLVTSLALLVTVANACGGGASAGTRHPVQAEFHTGRSVGPPVVAAGAVWVPNEADGTVDRIDPARNRVVVTVRVGDPQVMVAGGCGPDSVHSFMFDTLLNRRCDLPSSVAGDARSVWAADNAARGLARIDPATNQVVQRIALNVDPFAIALGFGSLWVTAYFNDPHEVLRVDPTSGRILATITDLPLGGGTGIAAGEGAVWVACTYGQSLARIDPSTDRVTKSIPVQRYPLAVSAGRGAVWVRNENSSSVSRIDPKTDRVTATVRGLSPPIGRSGEDAMALGPDGLWTTGIQLLLVDPVRNRVTARIDVSGNGISEGFGSLWMTSIFGTVQRVDPRSAVPVRGGG
jgi:YVTN family beta-propeller protein